MQMKKKQRKKAWVRSPQSPKITADKKAQMLGEVAAIIKA